MGGGREDPGEGLAMVLELRMSQGRWGWVQKGTLWPRA